MPNEKGYCPNLAGLVLDALKISQDGYGVFAPDNTLVFCNDTLARAFGFTPDDILGDSFERILRRSCESGRGIKADNDDVDAMIERAIAKRLEIGQATFESDTMTGDWWLVSRLKTEDNYIFVHAQDITQLKNTEFDLKEALRHVESLAATDALTGISNRRHFLEISEEIFCCSQRYHQPLSLLALDIDHFKTINDNYGHQAGDQVLVELTQRISQLLRSSDCFARLGGEEFAVLLPNTGGRAAWKTANRLLKSIARMEVNYEDSSIHFTTSIGISENTQHCASLEMLMRQADEALYRAKDNGRNRIEQWQPAELPEE